MIDENQTTYPQELSVFMFSASSPVIGKHRLYPILPVTIGNKAIYYKSVLCELISELSNTNSIFDEIEY